MRGTCTNEPAAVAADGSGAAASCSRLAAGALWLCNAAAAPLPLSLLLLSLPPPLLLFAACPVALMGPAREVVISCRNASSSAGDAAKSKPAGQGATGMGKHEEMECGTVPG